jgi:MFS family permease
MFKEFFSKKFEIPLKDALANIISITNVFVWYFCIFAILNRLIIEMGLNNFESIITWALNFSGAAISTIIGGTLADKIDKKIHLLSWIVLGIFSSLLLTNIAATSNLLILSSFFGISFGFGLPVCMGYYRDSTVIEKRARFGGVIFFLTYAVSFLLWMPIIASDNFRRGLILGIWRGLALTTLLVIKPFESPQRRSSYTFILSQKNFLLYFLPWIMFSLVNFLSIQIQYETLGESTAELLVLIENILVGSFAIIGGFLSDWFGRKHMAIIGFVMLGLGYAILGIYPESLISWYFYTLVDGAAWGIFHAIFLLAIWGDLAVNTSSEKYYALGGLPLLLSNFLRITAGSYFAKTVPAYAIFSFAAFFLFLAVVPLMFAPETLPEKKLRERELKKYIEKAKKIKEKYV